MDDLAGPSPTRAVEAIRSQPAAIEVTLVDLDLPEHELEAWTADVLDGEEQEVARGRVRPADRDAHLGSHLARRLLLAAWTGEAPAAITVVPSTCPLCGAAHGRPVVRSPRGVNVSLSRRGGLAMVAIGAHVVGVDVERVDGQVSVGDLAVALHPAEQAEMEALPAADRTKAALRCWCRKEALLKALGTGLGLDPATARVGMGSRPDVGGTVRVGPAPVDLAGWTVRDLVVGDGILAAVAHDGPGDVRVTVDRAGLSDLVAVHESRPR